MFHGSVITLQQVAEAGVVEASSRYEAWSRYTLKYSVQVDNVPKTLLWKLTRVAHGWEQFFGIDLMKHSPEADIYSKKKKKTEGK